MAADGMRTTPQGSLSPARKTTRIQFTDEELRAILMLVGNSLEDGAEEFDLDADWTNRLVAKLQNARRRLAR